MTRAGATTHKPRLFPQNQTRAGRLLAAGQKAFAIQERPESMDLDHIDHYSLGRDLRIEGQTVGILPGGAPEKGAE